MAPDSTVAGYRFESFELQPAERRLLAQGTQVTLGPRAFDVLLALVERAGHLVSKSQLLELVWPNLIVEENNSQVHADLRTAQDIGGRCHRYHSWTGLPIYAGDRADGSDAVAAAACRS